MTQNTEKQHFFSIITVTLNNIHGLRRTHDSLKTQSYQNFEWIVIDGGSNDGTDSYLKPTTANWSSAPDNGIYDAMNKGIERASGKYLLFLNAGDTIASPNILQSIKIVSAEKPDFIYGDALEDGAYKTARSANITGGMFTHHQSMFYSHKALGNIRYNLNYKIAADYDLTARFLSLNSKTRYHPAPICIFETGGVSQTQASLGRREQYQIRKNLKLTSPIKNMIITAAQALLWGLRLLTPSLYWHLKSSGNTPGEITQTKTPPGRPKNPT